MDVTKPYEFIWFFGGVLVQAGGLARDPEGTRAPGTPASPAHPGPGISGPEAYLGSTAVFVTLDK